MEDLNQVFEKHITVCKDKQTVISALAEHCPDISKQKLKQALQYGAVWLTPVNINTSFDKSTNSKIKTNDKSKPKVIRVRRAKKNLTIGEQLHLYYNADLLFSRIHPATLIADEGDYSIWNKPCGMFSQGTKWGDHSSIARWVELFGLKENQRSERNTYLVHRLDRATNGLMLLAHTKAAAKLLAQLFEARKVDKRYSAIVSGKYPTEPKFQELSANIDNKKARTIIFSSSYYPADNQSILLIKLDSGRKHQIRKHLLGVNYPIMGDRLYGAVDSSVEQLDLMLRSYQLEFKCPITHIHKRYRISPYCCKTN